MGTSGNELAVSATDFMTAITEFLCLSLSFLSRNYAIKTVKSAVGTDGVEEGKNRMLKARDNLNTDFARMAYFCIIRRNGNDEGEKFNAALSSLTYEAVHAGYRQARTHGTGEWFSQQFETWNKGDATLWCSGLPGAGKTFIASHAIDNIKKSLRPDIGLAYIYFDHKRYAEQTGPPGAQYGRPVFGSIMRQLLATRPSLIDEVLPLDINAPELDVVDKLCSLLKRFICTYLVVDALNEYSDDSDVRMRLVKELVATKERVGLKQFRIMITSRAADDVVKCVSPVQHIETKAEDADVKLMVLRRLEASTEFAERKMQSTTLSDDAVADQITRTAGKVYVHLQWTIIPYHETDQLLALSSRASRSRRFCDSRRFIRQTRPWRPCRKMWIRFTSNLWSVSRHKKTIEASKFLLGWLTQRRHYIHTSCRWP